MKKNRQDELKFFRKRVKDLSSLIEISRIVNSTLDLAKLLDIVMKIAKKVMRAEASSLMLIDDETNELVYEVALGKKGKELKKMFRLKMGQGIAGWVAKNKRPLLVRDVTKDPRFFNRPDKTTGFKTRSILCVPMKVKDKTIGILEAINPLDRDMFNDEDTDLFSAFASQAAIAIANARMHTQMLEKQRVEQELAVASQIQQNFLPRLCPKLDGLSVYAQSIPAREIGGDFYDFLKLDDNSLAIAIGDVSGKGVPAALYMVKVMTELRNHASDIYGPGETLSAVNNVLVKESMRGMFVTLLYAILNFRNKTITFSNAGHLPPIFLDRPAKKIIPLKESGNIPLGITPGIKYEEAKLEIEGDKLLVFYTDGIIEARNNRAKQFGIQRLKDVVRQKDLSAKNAVHSVIREVINFSKGTLQHDDLTILAVRIKD